MSKPQTTTPAAQKTHARGDLHLVPAPPEERRLYGAARAEQRRLEALARNGGSKAEPVPDKPEPARPGTTILVDGVEHATCTGRHGKCGAVVPMSELRVPGSVSWARNAIGNVLSRRLRYEELDVSLLAYVGFCRPCANKALPTGHQSVEEAIWDRDAKIAEIKARRAAEKAAREAEAKRKADRAMRARAKLAANGGAHGDPANPRRPAKYLAKKSARAAAERERQNKKGKGK